MTKEQFFETLDKYIAGNITPEEERTYHEFFETLQSKAMGWSLNDRERIKIEIYLQINKQIFPQKLKTERRNRFVRMATLWITAASVFLVTGTSLVYYVLRQANQIEYQTLATPARQKATLKLCDGTIIKLNSMSTIQYPTEFKGKTREVFLTGEAFFEVAKDSTQPFIIHLNGLITKVLGTSFNLKAYQGELLEITVSTGRVQVYADKANTPGSGNVDNIGKGLVLTPGQQGVFNPANGLLTKCNANLEQETAWRDNIIYIGESTLAETARVLERWYGISIVFQDLSIKNTLISGKFKSDKLVNILESLKFTKKIHYKINGDTVVLSKKTK